MFACNPEEFMLQDLARQAQDYRPEDDWTMEMIREDAAGESCCRCGDETADTVHGLCYGCAGA